MAIIETARLILKPATRGELEAELVSRSALAAALGAAVPEAWPPDLYDADAVRWTLDHLSVHPADENWGFYYMLGRDSGGASGLVGAGGFKGAPNGRGEVELGYSIVSTHWRQGLATEAVRAFIAFAFADSRVRTVVGQTIPSLVASMGVMEKAGMVFDGDGADPHAPEGERVLRYVIPRERYATS